MFHVKQPNRPKTSKSTEAAVRPGDDPLGPYDAPESLDALGH